jgi:hypothetical protein
VFRVTAEYARLACLLMVQITKIQKRDNVEFLETLGNAMIDDPARAQLDAWCNIVEFGRKVID